MIRRRYLPVVLFLAALGILTLLAAARSSPSLGASRSLNYSVPIGYWYMGNGAGWNSFLRLRADHTLSFQDSGDLADMPPESATWTLKGNRIVLKGSGVTQYLGFSLRIVRWQGYSVLVPQAHEHALLNAWGYPATLCFWQNEKGAQGGVKLPAQAWIDTRRTEQERVRRF